MQPCCLVVLSSKPHFLAFETHSLAHPVGKHTFPKYRGFGVLAWADHFISDYCRIRPQKGWMDGYISEDWNLFRRFKSWPSLPRRSAKHTYPIIADTLTNKGAGSSPEHLDALLVYYIRKYSNLFRSRRGCTPTAYTTRPPDLRYHHDIVEIHTASLLIFCSECKNLHPYPCKCTWWKL
jgi:hypothetical protein